MAEAFTNRLGEGVVTAESAGTRPGAALNPIVVEAMNEIGYDMSGHHPKVMTDAMVDSADNIITMGCGVSLDDAEGAVCPVFLVPSEDWALDDPHGRPIEEVRAIRDEIKSRVEALLRDHRP
jgi:protein-tyrosine-phosphatase